MPVRGFSFFVEPWAPAAFVPPARPLSPARTGSDASATASAAAIAGARSRATAVMVCPPSLDIRLARRPAIAELPPIRQRDLLQEAARLAAAKGRDDHGDHIALLHHVELPPDAIEDS